MVIVRNSTRFVKLGTVSPSKSGVCKVLEVVLGVGLCVASSEGSWIVPWSAFSTSLSFRACSSFSMLCDWAEMYLFFTRSGILDQWTNGLSDPKSISESYHTNRTSYLFNSTAAGTSWKHQKIYQIHLRVFSFDSATVSTSSVGWDSPNGARGLVFGPASPDWSHHLVMNKPVVFALFFFKDVDIVIEIQSKIMPCWAGLWFQQLLQLLLGTGLGPLSEPRPDVRYTDWTDCMILQGSKAMILILKIFKLYKYKYIYILFMLY